MVFYLINARCLLDGLYSMIHIIVFIQIIWADIEVLFISPEGNTRLVVFYWLK